MRLFGKKKEECPKIDKKTLIRPRVDKPDHCGRMARTREYIDYTKIDCEKYTKVDPERYYELLQKEQELKELPRVTHNYIEQKKIHEYVENFLPLPGEHHMCDMWNSYPISYISVNQKFYSDVTPKRLYELLELEVTHKMKLIEKDAQIEKLQQQVQMYKTGYGLAEENAKLKKELKEVKKKCEKNAELARKRLDLWLQGKKPISGFINHCPTCGKDGTLKHKYGWAIICEECQTEYDSVNGTEVYYGGSIGVGPCHKLKRCK